MFAWCVFCSTFAVVLVNTVVVSTASSFSSFSFNFIPSFRLDSSSDKMLYLFRCRGFEGKINSVKKKKISSHAHIYIYVRGKTETIFVCVRVYTQKALYDFGGTRSTHEFQMLNVVQCFSSSSSYSLHPKYIRKIFIGSKQWSMLKISRNIQQQQQQHQQRTKQLFFFRTNLTKSVSHTRIFISFRISTKRFSPLHVVKMNSHKMRSLNHAMRTYNIVRSTP